MKKVKDFETQVHTVCNKNALSKKKRCPFINSESDFIKFY